jgi:hypothetical protein
MTTRAALIWLVILGLLIGAWVAIRTPRAAPAPARTVSLLPVDAAAVRSITFDWPSGQHATISREPRTGLWLATGLVKEFQSAPWPTIDGRVQAAIRILRETSGEAIAEKSSATAKGVRLTIDAGTTHTLRFDAAPLGGSIGVEIEHGGPPDRTRVSAELATLFDAAAVASWSQSQLFPGGTDAATQLHVRSGDRSATMRKAAAWTLVDPPSPADAEAVRKLTTRLDKLSFTPTRGDATAALGEVSIEQEIRGWNGDTVRRDRFIRRVELLGAAGIDASKVSLRLSAELLAADGATPITLWGPIVAQADAEAFADISADPAAYASRQILTLPLADARWLMVSREDAGSGELQATKSLEGWSVVRAGSPWTSLDPRDLVPAVRWLVEGKAESVAFDAPPGRQQFGTIRIGPDEAGAVEIDVGVIPAEGNRPRRISVRVGPRWLSDGSAVAFRSIETLLGPSESK